MSLHDQVSILVVTRDHHKFIGQCLQSIEDEIGTDVQLFIVDVGSCDGTVELVHHLSGGKFEKVLVLEIPRESCPLDAYCAIRSHMLTPYLAVISGDDSFGHEYGLALSRFTRPELTPCVINFPLNVIDQCENLIEVRKPKWGENYLANRRLLLGGNPGTAPGTILPWSVLADLEIWETYPRILIEDYYLWWALLAKVKFINSDQGCVNYLRHEGAMTQKSANPAFANSLGYIVGVSFRHSRNLFEFFLSIYFLLKVARKIRSRTLGDFWSGMSRSRKDQIEL